MGRQEKRERKRGKEGGGKMEGNRVEGREGGRQTEAVGNRTDRQTDREKLLPPYLRENPKQNTFNVLCNKDKYFKQAYVKTLLVEGVSFALILCTRLFHMMGVNSISNFHNIGFLEPDTVVFCLEY